MQRIKPSGAEAVHVLPDQGLNTENAEQEFLLASRTLDKHQRQCELSVPDIRCGGCINQIEKEIGSLKNVTKVRVNLTSKQVTVDWNSQEAPPLVLRKLRSLGYSPQVMVDNTQANQDHTTPYLMRALAVAAFASGNIMLLSVSVWSGAEQQTKHLFHVLSALIALPSVAYSGQVFFLSAWRALRHRTTNMDVPISIGILLTLSLSCYDTFVRQSTEAVYFEAPVMLVFFLLIGRTLDHLMRERARNAVGGLAKLQPLGAWIVQDDKSVKYCALSEVSVGDKLRIAAGDFVAVDCLVERGSSDVDCALVTGESLPRSVGAGDKLLAGSRNLTADLYAISTAAVKDSYLSQMIALIQNIENTRSRGRRLADKISAWYAPVVHLTALLSCLAWYYLTNDLHHSVTIAIAVLIITCPCALGLAVPMVQVVIARRLFEAGIVVKDGAALERLTQIDTIVFDKTGTLTNGKPQLINADTIKPEAFNMAASMACVSEHPYSQALLNAFHHRIDTDLPENPSSAIEYPGFGLELIIDNGRYRLGRTSWATESLHEPLHESIDESIAHSNNNGTAQTGTAASETMLTRNGEVIATFLFEDSPRDEAASTINALRAKGISVHCLSGDTAHAVESCVAELAISHFKAELLPAEKVAYLDELASSGHKVMMIGDGLNDAPALAAAHVSMAPGSASEVGRNSADLVFTRNNLVAVEQALSLAHTANRSIRQNLAIALLYNALALPLAIGGWVTPLVAALAMSASSIIVMANALRLNTWRSASNNTKHQNSSKTLTPAAMATGKAATGKVGHYA